VLDVAATREAHPLTSEDLADAEDFADLLMRRMGGSRQWQVAEEIGVSQSRVSRWLAGGLPDREKLPLVAEWLGISDQELFVFLRDRHRRPAPRRSANERISELEHAMKELRAQVRQLSETLEATGAAKPRTPKR